ncbi:hypothetical protein GCM10010124_10680 [Pilimelia terevasa]|uniref:Lipoprotein n=1 Tax=Pilimelia terevasa TaxID=53372 RepID=A0A8J3FFX7_9ACTN|nr:hypothetical protein [Pilimelia terevasa]GGK19926.1 hypothetical protein GCM10010124_10680 [Pilimelia terevasa]
MQVPRLGRCALAAPAVLLAACGSPPPPYEDVIPRALRADFGPRVRVLVEEYQDTVAVDDAGARSACAVHLFGMEPNVARTVARVRTMFAWASCTWVRTEAGSVTDEAFAIDFQPGIQVRPTGENVREGVQREFPERLHEVAQIGPVGELARLDQERRRRAGEVAARSPVPRPTATRS